jgi:hypothetical protein
MHVIVIATAFLAFYFLEIDFVIVPRILSVLYSCFSVYFLLTSQSDSRFKDRYLFVAYTIFLHSLVFMTVEFEEKGITYFQLIMALNVLISLWSINKSELTKQEEAANKS